MNKELRRLIREIETQGFRVETKRKGWMLLPPDHTATPVMVSGTPSDKRAMDNILADLRRSGYRPTN